MRVKVNFLGILSRYTKVSSQEFELKPSSTFQDLLSEIGKTFNDQLPPEVWDKEENCFATKVLAVGSNGDIEDASAPLSEGEEINLLTPIVGG